MVYDVVKNRLLTYITDATLKSRVEVAFDKISKLNIKVDSVRDELDRKISDIDNILNLIDSGRIPHQAVSRRLEGVVKNLEGLPANSRKAQRQFFQEVERIKLIAVDVIKNYLSNAKSSFDSNNSEVMNRLTKGYNTALATEMLLKDLYAIINLDDIIIKSYSTLKGKTKEELASLLPCEIDKVWKDLIRTIDAAEKAQIESDIQTVATSESASIKLNGHNTFALLKTLPEKVQNLIKYQIIVRRVKDVDENIKLPTFEEFISVHDFMLLIKDFDDLTYADLFKTLKKNMILYSSDFDQKRYDIDKISEDNYKFNLAYFTATYMVLLHEFEDLEKYTCVRASEMDDESLKRSNVLVVPNEYEKIYDLYSRSLDTLIKGDSEKKELLDKLMNKSYFDWLMSLNKYNLFILVSKFNENEIDWLYEENKNNQNNFEDTLYYFIYLKSYLKGLDLDLTDKNIERVSKFIELVNNTNDLSQLEFQYNNWLGSIRIEDFTPQELEILEKFDPNYINGIENYSLKSYHYLCKKVNAYFAPDIPLIGTRDAMHKAALYQYLVDIDVNYIPEYLVEKDYLTSLSIIKELEEQGIPFEDIPGYYFSYDQDVGYNIINVINFMNYKEIRQFILPEYLVPIYEQEANDLINVISLLHEKHYDVETILKMDAFKDFSITDLNFVINFILSSNLDIDIASMTPEMFDKDYPKELGLMSYKYGFDLANVPSYYKEQNPFVLAELIEIFNKCGYDVCKIPYHYFHFYFTGFGEKLMDMHKAGNDILNINLPYFISRIDGDNEVDSYLTYLAVQIPTLITGEYSKIAVEYAKSLIGFNDISHYIIMLAMVDYICRGKNVRLLSVSDFSFYASLVKKNSYLSENKLNEITIAATRKYEQNKGPVDFKVADRVNSIMKSEFGPILYNNSTENLIRGLYTALGVEDYEAYVFIKNYYNDLNFRELTSLIQVLRYYVDAGLNANRMPPYLLGLDSTTNYCNLEKIATLFKKYDYPVELIPYYYLYDSCGNGFNQVYNDNVYNILKKMEESNLTFAQLPFEIINSSPAQIDSLISFCMRYNYDIIDIPTILYRKKLGNDVDSVVKYFSEKGVELKDIPERFFQAKPGVSLLLNIYDRNGLDWKNITDRLLNADYDAVKELYALGKDLRKATDQELKYGYYGAKYLEFVNKLDVEEGMVYLSQSDIAEAFNMYYKHNSMYNVNKLLTSKELLYKSLYDLHTILEMFDFELLTCDLRVLYLPYEFIIKYPRYAAEYFEQYTGEMTYQEADRVAGMIVDRLSYIPEESIDLNPNSPNYTPKKVVSDILTPTSFRHNRRK